MMSLKRIGIEQKKEHVLALLSLWNLFPSPLYGYNSGSKATSTLLTWLMLLKVGPDGFLFFFFFLEGIYLSNSGQDFKWNCQLSFYIFCK